MWLLRKNIKYKISYVLHRFDKDHPRTLVYNSKLHDALLPCIQHSHHM